MDRLFTARQLIQKYAGKYIRVHVTIDYTRKDENGAFLRLYSVTGISKTVREEYSQPEDAI